MQALSSRAITRLLQQLNGDTNLLRLGLRQLVLIYVHHTHYRTPFLCLLHPEKELRPLLERWIDQFSSDGFAKEISSKGVKAWAVGYEDAAHHVDLLVERLAKVLSELKSL